MDQKDVQVRGADRKKKFGRDKVQEWGKEEMCHSGNGYFCDVLMGK